MLPLFRIGKGGSYDPASGMPALAAVVGSIGVPSTNANWIPESAYGNGPPTTVSTILPTEGRQAGHEPEH